MTTTLLDRITRHCAMLETGTHIFRFKQRQNSRIQLGKVEILDG